MRRALFLVVALIPFALPAVAEMIVPPGAAAVVVVNLPFAAPMRTFEQAFYVTSDGGAIITTQSADSPFVVVTAERLMFCVASGQRLSEVVSDYMRQRNRLRPYIAERFENSLAAELMLDRLQAADVVSEGWVVRTREGGAFLVYRNPNL